MSLSKKHSALFFILPLAAILTCGPKTGAADKNDAGFFAGPLSAVAETVAEVKIVPPGSGKIIPGDENKQDTEDPEATAKTAPRVATKAHE